MNKTEIDEFTPFYIACQEGHLDLVKYLISLGVDMSKPDNDDVFTSLFNKVI
jgi:ankyrin repeat protein